MRRAGQGVGLGFTLLVALAVVLTGGQASSSRTSGATTAAVAPLEEWTGTWVTTFGQMVLKQSGNRVTGKYNWDGGRIVATVGLTAGGRSVLHGTWTELPTRKPPKDAGRFVWVMNANLRRFAGDYGYGTDDHHGGIWVGTRFIPEADVLVTLTVKKIAGAGGSVTGRGINCRSTKCTYALPDTYGAPKGTLTLAAKPAAGSRFDGWGGVCKGTVRTCTVMIDRNRAVEATFRK